MKVAILNSVCYGSTGKISRGIAQCVRDAGGEARIFFGRSDARGDADAVRVEGPAAIGAHLLLARLTDRQGFYSKHATQNLIRQIEAYDPDVVHLHNIHGYWLHMQTLFDFLAVFCKPVVWTLHDCWPFTGHCAYFDAVGCECWKAGCHDCPQKRMYPQSLLLDRSARNYTDKKRLFSSVPKLTLVTPSDWLAGLVRQSFLQGYPVRVLPNGIDLSVFRPAESELRVRHGLCGRKLLLGVAQVWDRRKGLASFAELRRALPAEYAIVLIGLTEKQTRELPDGITGLPRTKDAAELAKWYSAADVYVDCTHEENFPTTHLEALACGTPVVTFAAGGSAEMLTEACGAFVPVDDIAGMVNAIAKALRMERGACTAQAARYDAAARLGAYRTLYEEICK